MCARYSEIKKVICLIMIIIMLGNFIFPKYTYAAFDWFSKIGEEIDSAGGKDKANKAGNEAKNKFSEILEALEGTINKDEEVDELDSEGGELFTPITDFIISISDNVMGTLQTVFMEGNEVSNIISGESIKVRVDDDFYVYMIKYSPATIFANIIPAFNINFFEKNENNSTTTDVSTTKFKFNKIGYKTYKDCMNSLNAPEKVNIKYEKASLSQYGVGILGLINAINALEALADFDIPFKAAVDLGVEVDLGFLVSMGLFATLAAACLIEYKTMDSQRSVYYWRFWQNDDDGKCYAWTCKTTIAGETILDLLNINKTIFPGTLWEVTEISANYKKESSAFLLRDVISGWYYTFRTFALVALLSVLVYIGIRIILSSSSAENKAKYKKMLVSWFTAICILFALHYLMAFILKVTQSLIDVFEVSSLSEGGIDYFITNIRNSIVQENESYFKHWGYVIMYVSLVILTVSFTFQYIKRLIFVSLLTMIAPLVALTYPLDKMNDGRAQAFGIWIKEYVFNCLIQPVHLLLYTMVVSSAIDLMKNPIIAIVALALFGPAEKFIKNLFGFDKANSISQLGAMAGGAMLMNMLKNTPKGRRDESSSKTQNSNKIRESKDSSSAGENGNRYSSQSGSALENNSASSTSTGKSVIGKTIKNEEKNETGSKQNIEKTNNTNNIRTTSSTKNGVKSLARHYAIGGINKVASGGAKLMRTGAKAAGAFGGAIVGVAAGAADGEIGLPLKQVGVGVVAGSQIGSRLTPRGGAGARLASTINNGKEIYQRGALGNEQYDRMKLQKEFYSGNGWKNIENDSSIMGDKRTKTQEYLDAGIYDEKTIHNLLRNNISLEEYKDFQGAGITDEKVMSNLKKNNISTEEYKEFQSAGITDEKVMSNLKKNNISTEDYKVYKNYNITDMNKVSRIKTKQKNRTAEQIAKNMIVAEHGKPFINNEIEFTRLAKSCGYSDDEAADLWKNRGVYLV